MLLPVFTKIIYLSLESGVFADNWKCALVNPLLKKPGLDLVFKNFRPVSHPQYVKTVKTNDKIRRFGVFMTPLSRKILKKRSCKLQHLKRFWRQELTKEGAKIVKNFLKRL